QGFDRPLQCVEVFVLHSAIIIHGAGDVRWTCDVLKWRGERDAMAEHIEGPLYYERMGHSGPVMAFVHPNPMDQSCWIFQMAQFSTWFRCIAIDLPGYGRSPKAYPGLRMQDTAQACWQAVDEIGRGERAVLVGCSVGSALV